MQSISLYLLKFFFFFFQVYGSANSIGLLDIMGFENYSANSYEQLCINAASEQMDFFFNRFVFCWEREEYASEGILVHLDDSDTRYWIVFV